MNQQDFLQLKKEIVQRARVVPRPSPYQVQIERLQAQRLAQFIQLRLKQLHKRPVSLARMLDIEPEFVDALLHATFPVSELSTAMLNELAQSLRCEMADLVLAMRIEDDGSPTNGFDE